MKMKKAVRLFGVFLLAGYLCLYDGHLALRQDGIAVPVQIFPYSQELYPDADIRALRKGIRYETPQELAGLLEDYCS